MKKYLLSLITLTLFLCEASFTGGGMAFAGNKVGDSFTYNYTDNDVIVYSLTYTITKVYSSSTDYGEVKVKMTGAPTSARSIVIPQTPTWNYSGTKYYNVTAIEADGFKNSTYLTGVTIPSRVTSVGSSAFEGCTSLAYISFSGTSVTSWPSSMCKGCTSLTKIGSTNNRITVYSAVTSIGSSAFEGCTSITSVLFSGTSVTSFASNVFKGCTSLTQMGSTSGTFIIPNYVTTINSSAFANCTGITKLTIGTGVTTLNSAAFSGCTNITTVTWNATNCTSSYTISANPFSASKDKITSFTFGNSITRIPAYLCYQMSEIPTITIPQTVTNMGYGVFLGCSKLKEVTWNAANCADFTKSSGSVPKYSTPFCEWTVSGDPSKAENIEKITFGSGVTHVPAYLCFYCSKLKTVVWEAGSATIGTGAFGSCDALKNIIWNKTNCADFASASATPFYSIQSKIESFSFKNSVTLIPAYLCDGMINLKQVSLPSTVTTIGANAFNGCTGMEVFACAKTTAPTAAASSFTDVPCCLTVPTDSWDSYKDATGWSHFNNAGCSNAPSNIVRGTCGAQGKNLVWELNLTSGEMTISGTGEMADYSSSGNTSPWYDYRASIKNVTINEGVTSIGKYAFYKCENIQSSVLPKSLAKIEYEAFWYCYAMEEVSFAENCELSYIGNYAFEQCTTLTHITIPENVQTFGGTGVFSNSAVQSVTWNARHCNDFTSNNGPFNSKKTAITSFTFGDAVEYIPAYLCDGMSNASFTSITIPENVESINANAFNGCSSLNSITWNAVDCADFTTASANPFYALRANIQSVTFGSNVEHIPARLCYGMDNESFTSLSIGANVQSIGISAFENCSTLISLDLSGASSLQTIGNSAFDGCSNVEGELYIPASVSSVSGYVFNDFSKVTSMRVMPTSVPSGATATTFSNMVKTIPVYFASLAYTTANYWKAFTNYTCSGYCGAEEGGLNLTWTYTNSNKTLTISGTGAMANYNSAASVPWSAYQSAISSVVVESGVTSLGKYAFANCTALSSTSIAYSCTTFGMYSFNGCASLTEFTFPTGTTATGGWMFSGCTNLSDVTLPNGLLEIDVRTFDNTAISSITIPSSVTEIDNYAFYNCTSLESIDLSNGLVTIGSDVFMGCTSLASITIPGSVTTIKSSAFKDCSALETVFFSGTPQVTAIQDNTFENCSTLNNFTIPVSVTTIGKSAFKSCAALTSITIPENVTTITCTPSYGSTTYNTFAGCSNLVSVVWNATNCTNTGFAKIGTSSGYNYASPFVGLSSITSFTFGDNVETIPNYLCYSLSGLISVTIPASVESIGNEAFEGCSGIELVTCDATTPPTVQSNTFSSITSNAVLVVQGASKANYVAADYWQDFYRILPYVVQYDLNGHGSAEIADEYVGYGGRIETAPYDTETGYTFGGWYQEEGCTTPFNFGESGTVVNADMTLYAKWTANNYYITYKDKGDDVAYSGSNIGSLPATHTYDAATELVDGVKTGYTFDGWFANSDCTGDAVTSLGATDYTDDITLYAKWTINQYTVSFDSDGGSAVASITQDYNSAVEAPTDPTKTGYTFAGWTPAVPSTMPAEDTECVAQWTINQYTVSFDSNGGSEVSSITQDYNSAVTAPADPTKTGYTFDGWSPAVPSTMPAENVECVAQWTINSYDVTFDLQGHGDAIDAQSVNYNGLVSEPSDPSETGYTFGGWYKEAGCSNAWNFSTDKVTDDLVLYAKWTIISYDVTFDLQGHGDPIAPQSVDYNGLVSQPSAPSEAGFAFDGWFKEAGCSNEWNFSEDHVTSATTLYAKWTLDDLTLNDNANNASVLELYNTETTNVHLTRTIISASYNTICLPFAMTAGQVEMYFGENCDIEELTRASFADGNLKLFFTKRTAIEAGKPYLIQPQSDVANPTIAGVTIDNTSRPSIFDGVTFTGIFSKTHLENDENLLFVGASNTLYMSSGGDMKGMRGYFELTTPQAQAAAKRSARIILHEEGATGIDEVRSEKATAARSEKIMRNGQLFILRDGKTYNAQGALIK